MKSDAAISVLAFVLTFSLAAPADAARFSIACQGTARSKSNLSGRPRLSIYNMPVQVYVVDEEKSTVQRALPPRQQFEDVCSINHKPAVFSVSPGLVVTVAEGSDGDASVSCSFELDRIEGKAKWIDKMIFSNGRTLEWDWEMICKSAPMPIFDTSKNKF